MVWSWQGETTLFTERISRWGGGGGECFSQHGLVTIHNKKQFKVD